MREKKLLVEIARNTTPKDVSVGTVRRYYVRESSVGAAGLDHDWTVPENVTWRVLSILQTVNRGGAGNRTLYVNTYSVANHNYYSLGPQSATVDATIGVTYAPNVSYAYTAGFKNAQCPIPDILFQEGDGISVNYEGSVAADTCTTVMYLEETKVV